MARLAPDVRTVSSRLPEHFPVATDAAQQAWLAELVTVGGILAHGLPGLIVLRFVGRSFELWTLSGGLPDDVDDVVRIVCARAPCPDGVALVQLVQFDEPEAQGVGIQVVAERAGQRAERWILLDFPEGPDGPRRVARVLTRQLGEPVDPGWLGVAPRASLDVVPEG